MRHLAPSAQAACSAACRRVVGWSAPASAPRWGRRPSTVLAGNGVIAGAALGVVGWLGSCGVAWCADASKRLLSDIQVAEVSAIIAEQYSVPLVPQALQNVIIGQAVQSVADQLEVSLPGATSSKFTQHFQDALAIGLTDELLGELLRDLNGVLDIPLLNEEQEEKILRLIIQTMLADGSIGTQAAAASVYSGAQGVKGLLDKSSRKELVDKINATVDIPLLSEEQEGALIESALDHVAEALTLIIPPQWLSLIEGSSTIEMDGLQELLVQRADSMIPSVPPISAERKHEMIAALVSLVFESAIKGGALEEAVSSLNPEEREAFLKKKVERLQVELDLHDRAAARKRAYLLRQIAEAKGGGIASRLPDSEAVIAGAAGMLSMCGLISVCAACALGVSRAYGE